MNKAEIIKMAIRELTENALGRRRGELPPDEAQIYRDAERLAEQAEKILSELSSDKQQIVANYIETKELIADRECAFLYVQGAKDVVELLTKLGIYRSE